MYTFRCAYSTLTASSHMQHARLRSSVLFLFFMLYVMSCCFSTLVRENDISFSCILCKCINNKNDLT